MYEEKEYQCFSFCYIDKRWLSCSYWRSVFYIMDDCMIAEAKRELIDKQEFYQSILNQMKQHGDATLNSTLTLGEIVEVFDELPLYNEPSAEWIRDKIEDRYACSWCHMMGNYYDRYCSYCGRRMKRSLND